MPKAARPVSTTIPTRMGLAVPSLAEASRRLPSSVKADPASADDVLVTSVAIPPAIDEAVSPELALVDPELRERLRALLPEESSSSRLRRSFAPSRTRSRTRP